MKSPIAAMALCGTLAASTAWAQSGVPATSSSQPRSPLFSTGSTPPAQAPGASGTKQVYPNASTLPEPTPADELKAPGMALPNDPIEPWLLTREAGPFMVLAKTFRGKGPEVDRMALALAKELHDKYGLPAYILRSKDFPGKSNIRGVPPTADREVVQANVQTPEKYRTYDEAAVLVGNVKTEKEAAALLHKVKKIKPECLSSMPSIFKWREGLQTALRTTNPYVAAQYLYPHTHDRLIVQINQTSRSIVNCPGRYSLQIAEFAGRSTFNDKDERFQGILSLKKSPLATAASDAEHLADRLANDPDIQKLRQPIYVYHDRTASRVFFGSFNTEKDPAAVEVRDELLKLAVPLLDRKRPTGGLDTMIVPAGMLTDLKDIKAKFEG
ncbi:MAG TPA: hypothetical protein VJY33_15205 [Isosphaeraceae bacterium]|nr:hypothetical protein [Isosphaeraceae bacterium]